MTDPYWNTHIPQPPIYVGGYRLGPHPSITFNLTRTPAAWHRFWMRVCLGWVWVDAMPMAPPQQGAVLNGSLGRFSEEP